MRSVIFSACFISSIDSSRVYAASLVNPQFCCIFECRKYWLIAVSSLVSCSFKREMISESPRTVWTLASGSGVSRLRQRSRSELGKALGGEQEHVDLVVAGAAAGACRAGIADVFDRAGAARHRRADLVLGHTLADADVHQAALRSG